LQPISAGIREDVEIELGDDEIVELGHGEEGPYRDMKAYDLLIQGETGLASITSSPDAPGRVGVSVSVSAGPPLQFATLLHGHGIAV